MCGIVGLITKQKSNLDQTAFILNQLENLQDRGYSGCGVAGFNGRKIVWCKSEGSVQKLRGTLNDFTVRDVAISHLRWFTHGRESPVNSHPHLSNDKSFAVVHNGEIYNKDSIKTFLEKEGFNFESETDTECIPNLMQLYFNKHKDLKKAFAETVRQLDGSNAMLLITTHSPDQIMVYNNCQTLSLVDTEDYYLMLSDDAAIPAGNHTQYHIHDDDLVFVSSEGFEFVNRENVSGEQITIDLTETTKGSYKHFMEKEIREQPYTLGRTIAGRINERTNEIVLGFEQRLTKPLRQYKKIALIGIGTSYYACLVGRYFFEDIAKIPVTVYMGSEFLDRPWMEDSESTLVLVLSQSGKTIELIDIVKYLQPLGVEVAAICNVVKSPLAKMASAGIFLKAGPEKAVASTKAYTSQLIALHLLATLFASRRGASRIETAQQTKLISGIPDLVKKCLEMTDNKCQEIAQQLKEVNSIFYLGRGINWPLTLEGALKMQEVAYINAQGYSAAMMFHGPRALLNPTLPCISMLNKADPMHQQMISSVEKCHSAHAPSICIIGEELAKEVYFEFPIDRITVPEVESPYLLPYVNIIPLQLLAYHTAVAKGNDPDYPVNLAKVITTR